MTVVLNDNNILNLNKLSRYLINIDTEDIVK